MSTTPLVLKFGSSVLRTADDLSGVVDEIYRAVRKPRPVIAVVSAYAGATQTLLQSTDAFGARLDGHAIAALAATGEQVAAAHLTLALGQFGIHARYVDPREIRLGASGTALDAEADDVAVERLMDMLGDFAALVIPGFFASDRCGRTVLLGRGGSDQTALFLAQRLGADCLLLKDTQGIYDHDPSEAGPVTRRFESISWSEAAKVAGKLVQPKALRYAQRTGVAFDVARPSWPNKTQVGAFSEVTAGIQNPPRPMRIALLGLGTVGLGVYRELQRRAEQFEVVRVAVRHPARHVASGMPQTLLTHDALAAVHDAVDLVIEVMGGLDPAEAVIRSALAARIPVVTANKALLALSIDALELLARRNAVSLCYSAAVGGGVPMLEYIHQAVAAKRRIAGFSAILNGTCNVVLEHLEAGGDLAGAVEYAQASGFAEADPSSDLSGADAAAKLGLLARSAYSLPIVPSVQAHGIDESTRARAQAARSHGKALRLIARCHTIRGMLQLTVSLEELDLGWLSAASAEENRLEIVFEDGTIQRIAGRGAGRWPTTVSVMADVLSVWRSWLETEVSGTLMHDPGSHPKSCVEDFRGTGALSV